MVETFTYRKTQVASRSKTRDQFLNKTIFYNSPKIDVSPSKFLVYRPNGSGRDSYISSNSGGFRVYPETVKHMSFQNSLREHAPLKVYHSPKKAKNSRIVLTKFDWYSPKIKRSIIKAGNIQKLKCRELSVPKSREKATKQALLRSNFTLKNTNSRRPESNVWLSRSYAHYPVAHNRSKTMSLNKTNKFHNSSFKKAIMEPY